MSPRSEATTEFVRVSNAVSSPPAQTARYRRHVNVTPTVPQETLVSRFHRSHQLLPGSNAVSVFLTCLDCRHHAKWTQRTGPTFCSSVVGKIATTTRMMCWYLLMVGMTLLFGPCCACASWSGCLFPWNSRDNLVTARVRELVDRSLPTFAIPGQRVAFLKLLRGRGVHDTRDGGLSLASFRSVKNLDARDHCGISPH